MKIYYRVIILLTCLMSSSCKTLLTQPVNMPPVEQYLAYMETLSKLNSHELSKAHYQAEQAYQADRNIDKQLYLALTEARTGYKQTDLDSARAHFMAIINSDALLPDPIKHLVKVELQHAIVLIQLKKSVSERTAEMNKLKSRINRLEKQLDSLSENNQNLQEALEEANDKLRALTDIEQDLSQTTKSDN